MRLRLWFGFSQQYLTERHWSLATPIMNKQSIFFLLTLGSFVEALSPSSIFMCLSLSMSDTNFEPRPAQDQRMTRGTERCKTCNYFAANLVLGSKSRQLFHGTLLRPRMEGATQCISTASNFGGANKFETC